MDWTCECGTENPDGAKFCNQCGAPKPPAQPAAVPADVQPSAGVSGAAPGGATAVPPADAATPEREGTAAPEGGSGRSETGTGFQAATNGGVPATGHPPAEPAAPPKKRKGCLVWSLVILVVLLVFCLIAAAVGYFVVWPKMKSGNRIKQATAVAEMTRISLALEGYKSAHGAYPSPGHNPDSYYSIVDLQKLSPQLSPDYLKKVPEDPWGHPYQYGTSPDDASYVLICTGSDGVNALEQIPAQPKDTHCYEDEIVLEKGTFMQKPSGRQRNCSKSG